MGILGKSKLENEWLVRLHCRLVGNENAYLRT